MKQKIVTIGGGTGSFVVLSGLKKFPVDLTAIVSMADNGGSTGVLRDELGVLPPGDVRQCLVALSGSDEVLRELFSYRFSRGSLSGHTFGNIFLSTLEKITGDFNKAVKEAGAILRINGRVVPITLTNTNLKAVLNNGRTIKNEVNLQDVDLSGLKKIELDPPAAANPEAIRAIREADKIIINSGNLYCTIIPNFLVKSIAREVARAKAKKIYICNLMTQKGQTDNFFVHNFVGLIEKYLGKNTLDYVIYNEEMPRVALTKKYAGTGGKIVKFDRISLAAKKPRYIGAKLLSHQIFLKKKGDILKRSLIRHNSDKLAEIIYNL
jgi:uncharacterized cofD-like protein